MPEYVPFYIGQLCVGIRQVIPRLPYLRDRRQEFQGISRIDEAILVLATAKADVDIIVFTSCVKQEDGRWKTRDAGEDRLRLCLRRRRGQGSAEQWTRIRHLNRTRNAIPTAASLIKKAMHGNASSWGTLEDAMKSTVEEGEPEVEAPLVPTPRAGVAPQGAAASTPFHGTPVPVPPSLVLPARGATSVHSPTPSIEQIAVTQGWLRRVLNWALRVFRR